MKPIVILYLFGIAVFATLASAAPFARGRIRARWAKIVLVMIGLFGIVDALLSLLREMHWFSLGFPTMDFVLLSLDVLILALFSALALTGQLFGKKRTEGNMTTLAATQGQGSQQ